MTPRGSGRGRLLAVVALAVVAGTRPAAADRTDAANAAGSPWLDEHPVAPAHPTRGRPSLTSVSSIPTALAFLGGATIAFVAHETGHLVTNLAYGNTPKLEGITTFGVIPFVAVAPRIRCSDTGCTKHDGSRFSGGHPGKYNIVTAGYDVQHLTTEVLLTLEPDLRWRRAPLRKGLFAFDILLSVGYALSSMTGTESNFGDAGTAADTARLSRTTFAAVLLAPAVLDVYRYLQPRSKWAPWASRAAKGSMIGISFAL